MANAAASGSTSSTTSTSFIELKTAYSTSMLQQILTKFNIGTTVSYFLETRVDFKAIRANSFELFTFGHVHHISVKQDEVAKKAIVSADVLAHMKQQFDRVILILTLEGDIIYASCSCPAGCGPNYKHEAWNKPRLVKLPAAPIFDIDFTRKQHGIKKKTEPAI